MCSLALPAVACSPVGAACLPDAGAICFDQLQRLRLRLLPGQSAQQVVHLLSTLHHLLHAPALQALTLSILP